MRSVTATVAPHTFLELEFDTTPDRGAPLGDIASSLVSLHDLLRDLATLVTEPGSAEFRDIQVVAIQLATPLKVRLSLTGIPAEAVKAFQEICRDVILDRERGVESRAVARGLESLVGSGNSERVSEQERQRFRDHLATLQQAAVPLKRVVVINAA